MFTLYFNFPCSCLKYEMLHHLRGMTVSQVVLLHPNDIQYTFPRVVMKYKMLQKQSSSLICFTIVLFT